MPGCVIAARRRDSLLAGGLLSKGGDHRARIARAVLLVGAVSGACGALAAMLDGTADAEHWSCQEGRHRQQGRDGGRGPTASNACGGNGAAKHASKHTIRAGTVSIDPATREFPDRFPHPALLAVALSSPASSSLTTVLSGASPVRSSRVWGWQVKRRIW